MKTARFIKDVSRNFAGKAAVYKLSSHRYVLVSRMNLALEGRETMVFEANRFGIILDWSGLATHRESHSLYKNPHEDALRRMGYTIR